MKETTFNGVLHVQLPSGKLVPKSTYEEILKVVSWEGKTLEKRKSELEEMEIGLKSREKECRDRELEAKRTLACAYAERNLVLNGLSDADYLTEIGRLKEKYAPSEWCEKESDEAKLKERITKLKRALKYLRTGEDNNGHYRFLKDKVFAYKDLELRKDFSVGDNFELNGYTCIDLSEIISSYFELASENIIKDAPRIGLAESEKRLLSLRRASEWHLCGGRLKFNEAYIQRKLELIQAVCQLEACKQQRKEQQQRERELIREEIRAQKEYERELRRAEKDEETARRKIEEMERKAETERGNAERFARYQTQIAELQAALQAAIERQERAKSMAQQTRRGFVYVISNVGSFGEGVYKIGLTRRLDPQERVDELGDASVPFRFDVHAMIESEDAPALETALHQAFAARKLNRVNGRKEFFRVSLDEIESEVRRCGIEAVFVKDAWAREWRDSLLREGVG